MILVERTQLCDFRKVFRGQIHVDIDFPEGECRETQGCGSLKGGLISRAYLDEGHRLGEG